MRITSLIALLLTSMLHAEISTEQNDAVISTPEQSDVVRTEISKISPEQSEIARLQIFLDQKKFGPGLIDGKSGTYTELAVANYNKLHGKAPADWDSIHKEAATAVPTIYATAIVPEIARELVDKEFPGGDNRVVHAKRHDMPYRTVVEFMAERYHTSVAFLTLLNGEEKINKATVRTALLVPNIEPFRIENLAQGRTHKQDETLSKRWAVVDTDAMQLRIYEPLETPAGTTEPLADAATPIAQEEAALPTDVLTAEPELETDSETAVDTDGPVVIRAVIVDDDPTPEQKLTPYDEHRALLVASFPITPGKSEFIRRGTWKIMNAIELPYWRFDPSLLKTGQRGSESLNIPAGPNNPVGVLWIGLSKKGIGIHGTDSPETIGRTRSAGCIRLANWDIVSLPTLIRPGATVIIK